MHVFVHANRINCSIDVECLNRGVMRVVVTWRVFGDLKVLKVELIG